MAPRPRVRVLVVDDDVLNRRVAERAFEVGGYEVVAAASGPEALTRVEASPEAFDLYVLDVMMPTMKGPELARRIRERQPDAKVLYVTGYSDYLFTGRNVLPGDEAFVEKPVTRKALLESASLLLFGHTGGIVENGR